jgi:uncharacterized protein YjeT (DUF2065 family)
VHGSTGSGKGNGPHLLLDGLDLVILVQCLRLSRVVEIIEVGTICFRPFGADEELSTLLLGLVIVSTGIVRWLLPTAGRRTALTVAVSVSTLRRRGTISAARLRSGRRATTRGRGLGVGSARPAWPETAAAGRRVGGVPRAGGLDRGDLNLVLAREERHVCSERRRVGRQESMDCRSRSSPLSRHQSLLTFLRPALIRGPRQRRSTLCLECVRAASRGSQSGALGSAVRPTPTALSQPLLASISTSSQTSPLPPRTQHGGPGVSLGTFDASVSHSARLDRSTDVFSDRAVCIGCASAHGCSGRGIVRDFSLSLIFPRLCPDCRGRPDC